MKLIKIPLINGLGKTKGCKKAPDKIISSIKEFYLNEEGMLPYFNIQEININNENIEESNKTIIRDLKQIIHNSDKTIILGGDHSLTYSCYSSFSVNEENPGLLVFDAHPDCMQDFSPATHEDFVKVLIKENKLKKQNLVLVGLRNWHKDEFQFLKENKIKFFSMNEISFEGLNEVSDSVMEIVRNFSSLYISIDIDVVDPSFAPGTGYAEPGGLTSRELLYFLKRLKLLKNLKVIDLVEINPDKDLNNMTVKLGAKIVTELT